MNTAFDLSRHLSTPFRKYEPTEAAIAARAKEVIKHWAKDEVRAYDKFYTALDEARSSDNTANALFDMWRAGLTSDLGLILAKAVDKEIYSMADQYARDEFAGVLGDRDERIPL